MLQGFEQFGLVLSGGGARGAYEIGVAKYLQEHNMIPSAYAGASIGALNAVFLAAAPSFKEGVERIEDIWTNLRTGDLFQVNNRAILYGFFIAGIKKLITKHPSLAVLGEMISFLSSNYKANVHFGDLVSNNLFQQEIKKGLLDNGFLKKMIDNEIGLDKISSSPQIWISACESRGIERDLLDYVLSEVGVRDTKDSHYFHLNRISIEQRLPIILSSAAIPAIYGSQVVEGKQYVDGGIGGAMTSRGNTPIAPLVNAGYRNCIVVHLSDGSFFDRNEYPGTTIIEIRPERSLYSHGKLKSLFDFNSEQIQLLIDQGYEDAERCIKSALLATELVHTNRAVVEKRKQAVKRLNEDRFDEVLGLLDE